MTFSTDIPKVTIIGAGVSGLVAALKLEELGYQPTILEADDQVGGRVQTDIVEGYQLDRGFQVLLEAYPKAQEYLDYEALNLQRLDDGSLLFSSGTVSLFGDPRRNQRFLVPMLFSSQASLRDKWKIYQLNNSLAKKELQEIFSSPSQTTLSYLKDQGLSSRVIEAFFKPFFSGIFLEDQLETSSRMFEFVFKMFGTGSAVIPKNGMGEIPNQLKHKLNHTTFRFGTCVKKVVGEEIALASGEILHSDFTIIAANPNPIIPNYATSQQWRSCDNLYFTMDHRTIEEPIIGLNSTNEGLVNNFFFPTSIACEKKGSQELLSVTVVKDHSLAEEALITRVTHELSEAFGIKNPSFLKRYHIKEALPMLDDLQFTRDATEQLLTDRIALAGDYLLNGSLNAAMEAGENAAYIAHASPQNIKP